MYVKVNNGTVTAYPYSVGQLMADNPNTSFPEYPSAELLEEWGVFAVQPTTVPTIDHTQQLVESTPVYDNGWKQVWSVNTLSAEEVNGKTQQQADDIRTERNRLLLATDWTQLPDALTDVDKQQSWATYRQNLRDITNQAGFPWSVIWPISPDPITTPILMPLRFR